MVLAYLQVPVSYKRLVRLRRIGPAGAPFRNLRHLEALGLSISIEQGEIETLRWQIEQGFPPIVFVNTKDLSYWHETTGHAVIVAGFEGDLIIWTIPPSLMPLRLCR
jgi:hypothetical protein